MPAADGGRVQPHVALSAQDHAGVSGYRQRIEYVEDLRLVYRWPGALVWARAYSATWAWVANHTPCREVR